MAEEQPIIHRRRSPANKVPQDVRDAIVQMCRDGKTVKEIRSLVLCGFTAIYGVLRDAGLRPSNTTFKFTDADREAIFERYRAGQKIRTIANELGLPQSTVHGILVRHEIIGPRVCKRCKRVETKNRGWLCDDCRKDKHADKAERRRQRLRSNGKCIRCLKPNDKSGNECSECAEKQAQKRRDLKKRVVDGYGGACNCCGERTLLFLTVDHVNNDGGKRRLLGEYSGHPLHLQIVRDNFPPDLTILCWNCQMGKKFNKGVCPHKATS